MEQKILIFEVNPVTAVYGLNIGLKTWDTYLYVVHHLLPFHRLFIHIILHIIVIAICNQSIFTALPKHFAKHTCFVQINTNISKQSIFLVSCDVH